MSTKNITMLNPGDWFQFPNDDSLWILKGRVSGLHSASCLSPGDGVYQIGHTYPIPGNTVVILITDMPAWYSLLCEVFELDLEKDDVWLDASKGSKVIRYKHPKFIVTIKLGDSVGWVVCLHIPSGKDDEVDVWRTYALVSLDDLAGALSAIWTELDRTLSTKVEVKADVLKPGDQFSIAILGSDPHKGILWEFQKWANLHTRSARCKCLHISSTAPNPYTFEVGRTYRNNHLTKRHATLYRYDNFK